jgi:hypothetical protein
MLENMNEIWKDIEGYEGLYQVSNLGRIKSLSRITTSHKRSVYQTKEMIMKYKKSRDYNSIGLSKYGNTKYYRVARMVASAFIPNPNNLPQVNHKDCNKRNDYASNLEWCDAISGDTQNRMKAVAIPATAYPLPKP